MDKQAMRAEVERLIREAKKPIEVTKGKTKIIAKCLKCGAPNRVTLPTGETRAKFTCKECGTEQASL